MLPVETMPRRPDGGAAMSTRPSVSFSRLPRRGALQVLGAALLGLADACREIRGVSRTG
jgi:hypothetical protein